MQPRRLLRASFASLSCFCATVVIVACTGDDPEAVGGRCTDPVLCSDSGGPATGDGSPTPDGTATTDVPVADAGCTAPCNGDLMWLRSFGSIQGESVDRAVLDSTGNIYILGYAGAAIGLADDGGAPNIDAAGRFVAKLDPDGKPLWAKTITGSTPRVDIAVAADGTLFVGGNYFRNASQTLPVTWGGVDTLLGTNVGAPSGYDIFVLKVGTDGTLQAKTQIGATNYDDFQAMNVVADGSPVIFGNCLQAISTGATIPAGAFAIKLAPTTLAATWVHPISATNVQQVGGLGFASLKNGDIAMAARYSGSIGFGGGPVSNPSSTNATDTFIGRLSGADGTLASGQSDSMSIYGSNALVGSKTLLSSLAFFDSPTSPSIAVVGGFEGWVGLAGTNPSLMVGDGGAKTPATFLAIFSANSFAPLDQRAILDGTLPGVNKYVAFDKDGNVTVAGSMKADVDYGGGVPLKSNGGADDGVVAHYGTALKDHKWSMRFGGPAIDRVAGMGIDPNNNIVLVGEFRANAEFPHKMGSALPETLMSKDGKPNIFVMKLAR